MSPLQRSSGGQFESGGIVGYPLETLYEEVAFVTYYFHWEHDVIMNMPHDERKKWCDEISKINKQLTGKGERKHGTHTPGRSLLEL